MDVPIDLTRASCFVLSAGLGVFSGDCASAVLSAPNKAQVDPILMFWDSKDELAMHFTIDIPTFFVEEERSEAPNHNVRAMVSVAYIVRGVWCQLLKAWCLASGAAF